MTAAKSDTETSQNEKRGRGVERLKVTSPRLEQDVFYFTPSGRPDRPDARRTDQQTKSRRPVHKKEMDDGTEQTALGCTVGAGTEQDTGTETPTKAYTEGCDHE